MRAFMSRKDEYAADPLRSPVSNLKPDMFAADLAWLEAQSLSEARAILSETEPPAELLVRGYRHPGQRIAPDAIGRPAFEALAEALSAFVNE